MDKLQYVFFRDDGKIEAFETRKEAIRATMSSSGRLFDIFGNKVVYKIKAGNIVEIKTGGGGHSVRNVQVCRRATDSD